MPFPLEQTPAVRPPGPGQYTMAPSVSLARDLETNLEPALGLELIFFGPPAHTRSQFLRISRLLPLIHELPIELQ